MNKLFLILLVPFSLSHSHAQNVLVSTVTEFNTAVVNAQAGDTIFLKNGTWEDAQLDFFTSGTSDKPVVLKAQTPGEVILSGAARLRIYGEHLVVSDLDFQNGSSSGDDIIQFKKSSNELAKNCRLTNTRILNFNPASDDIAYKWVSIYGDNNRVDHCHFDGKNNEGALLVVWLTGEASHHQIDHNYFANIPELGRNGGETIRIGTSTNSLTESRTIVEYNLFESCDGEIEIISNKSGFNIYRYNTFRNNEGMLTLRHGDDCEVYGNFFFGGEGKSSGGVRIIGERHKVYNNYFQDLEGDGLRAAISMMNGVPDSPLNRYFQVKNAEVVNNTIVSCKEPFAIGEGNDSERTLPPLDCTIANNIAISTTGSKSITYTDTPINMTYESNYITGSTDVSDEGIINQDPGLELIDGLWVASSESEVVDVESLTVSYLEFDIDGQLRDDSPDIGCDELASTAKINQPLTQDDVGYDWTDTGGSIPILSVYETDASIQLKFTRTGFEISGIKEEDLPAQVIIHDLQGKKLVNDRVSSPTFSLPISLKGVYVVSLITQEGSIRYKAKVQFSERK
ncbi:MAG: polysaccharide lyase 6 family protein [Reichenbachiella sp.]|uniref:polysaccharide lyase 6 family protein n=1 Tax=Reichenbachiella sp. TaxID=2184521 RepID=UPI002966C739|nr:polysaccharide lyase 6 family protein [Reichenbachiella sp.]MDW3210634.1 polysaccharide lyase 6 family protein [Reichenbachiella sp.]